MKKTPLSMRATIESRRANENWDGSSHDRWVETCADYCTVLRINASISLASRGAVDIRLSPLEVRT
jgi:hypothetical protein